MTQAPIGYNPRPRRDGPDGLRLLPDLPSATILYLVDCLQYRLRLLPDLPSATILRTTAQQSIQLRLLPRSPIGYNGRWIAHLPARVAVTPRSPIGYNVARHLVSLQQLRLLPDLPSATMAGG